LERQEVAYVEEDSWRRIEMKWQIEMFVEKVGEI
jgi:hypothetical protein